MNPRRCRSTGAVRPPIANPRRMLFKRWHSATWKGQGTFYDGFRRGKRVGSVSRRHEILSGRSAGSRGAAAPTTAVCVFSALTGMNTRLLAVVVAPSIRQAADFASLETTSERPNKPTNRTTHEVKYLFYLLFRKDSLYCFKLAYKSEWSTNKSTDRKA